MSLSPLLESFERDKGDECFFLCNAQAGSQYPGMGHTSSGNTTGSTAAGTSITISTYYFWSYPIQNDQFKFVKLLKLNHKRTENL